MSSVNHSSVFASATGYQVSDLIMWCSSVLMTDGRNPAKMAEVADLLSLLAGRVEEMVDVQNGTKRGEVTAW